MGGRMAGVLRLTLISLLVAYVHSQRCEDFASLSEGKSREVVLYVKSECCGGPITNVHKAIQVCQGENKVIQMVDQDVTGLYKYIGPKKMHKLRIDMDGFKPTKVLVRRRYMSKPIVVKLPCIKCKIYNVHLVSKCSDSVSGAIFSLAATETQPGIYDVKVCEGDTTLTIKLPQSDKLDDVVYALPDNNSDTLTIQTPCLINQMGTSFMFGFMSTYNNSDTSGRCRIYITCAGTTNVRVRIPFLAVDYNQTFTESTLFEFSHDLVVVFYDALVQSKGVEVTSDDPVSVYYENYLSYSTDGSFVLPAPALGNLYILNTYTLSYSYNLFAQALISCLVDGTHVNITYRYSNSPETVILNKYDVFQLQNLTLAEAFVSASHPIHVQIGHVCADIYKSARLSRRQCDLISSAILPITQLPPNLYIIPVMEPRPIFYISVVIPYIYTNIQMWKDYQLFNFTIPSPQSRLISYNSGNDAYAIALLTTKPIMVSQFGISSVNRFESFPYTGDSSLTFIPAVEQYTNVYRFVKPLGYNEYTICIVIEDLYSVSGLRLNDASFTPNITHTYNVPPLGSYEARAFNLVYLSLGDIIANTLTHISALATFGAYLYARNVGQSFNTTSELSMALGFEIISDFSN